MVDSFDLPLNISRQTLQQDRHITQIRKWLTKKVLDLLVELFEKDYDNYLKFWGQFGRALKEGGSSEYENKDRILMPLDFAPGHPTRVERDDFVVKAVEARLPLLDELRGELPVAVMRDFNRDLTLLAFERLARLAVAGIARVFSFGRVFLVAEMMSHLSVRVPFNQGLGELLEETTLTKQVFGFW